MSESNNNNNNKYPVVIKLALEASGDNGPFRRVVFTKQEVDSVNNADSSAAVGLLLDRLKERAIELATTTGRNPNVAAATATAAAAQCQVVRLTYKDADGDVCVVLSNADVLDALLQCQENNVSNLKMFAKVVSFASVKPRVKPCVVAAAATVVPVSTTAPTATASTSITIKNQNQNQQHNYQGNAPIAFHQLVESIVGVLATALLALQSHLGQSTSSIPMIEPKYTNIVKDVNVVPTTTASAPTSSAAVPTTSTTSSSDDDDTSSMPGLIPRRGATLAAAQGISNDNNNNRRYCPYMKAPTATITAPVPPCAPPTIKGPPSTPMPMHEAAAAVTAVTAAEEQKTSKEDTEASSCGRPFIHASSCGRPFIHGRHTCDSCLTTPIIGGRFHATNLPDYDLCANCHENYQGNNNKEMITFEAMELDRDRPFQDRWHRRYAKWGTTGRPHVRKHAAAACGGGRRPGRCGRGYNHGGFVAAAPTTTTTTPITPTPVVIAKPDEVDAALKEAIRRSMADLMSTINKASTATEATTAAMASRSKSVEDVADKMVKKMERVASKVSQAALKMADKNEIVVQKLHQKIDKVVARHNLMDQKDQVDKFHASLDSAAKAMTQSMEMVAAQMEQVVAKSSSPSLSSSSLGVEDSMNTMTPAAAVVVPVEKEIVDQVPMEKIVVESHTIKQVPTPPVVVKSVVVDKDNDEDSKPKAVDVPTTTSRTVVETTTTATASVATVHDEKEEEIVVEPLNVATAAVVDVDTSAAAAAATTTTSSASTFALDAAGNGDVAADLGATMDKIVTAIQDMKDELDRSSTSNINNNINTVESSDTDSFVDAQDSSEEDEEEDTDVDDEKEEDIATETQGATILSGEETHNKDDDDDDDDDSGSHNSWMVVHDQVTSDEALARAAQVIGSALFNSDMSRSAASGNISAMSHTSESSSQGSNTSQVSSVPTDIPSLATSGTTGGAQIVAQAQMDRWVLQLSQLHELGFYNDAICVDILERLQAANVGSGEDEEVTVTQVINELMREW